MEAKYDQLVIGSGAEACRLCRQTPHRNDTKLRLYGELHLSGGFRQRNFYGRSYVLKDRI